MAKKESWLPLPLQRLSQEVDRLFDELIYRPWGGSHPRTEEWSPQLDLYEDSEVFTLEADLPGVKKQDVTVTIEDDELVLQGKRSFERMTAEKNFYCRERCAGQFVRRLRLSASVTQAQIHAEFHNGVLRVTLPKQPKEKTTGE